MNKVHRLEKLIGAARESSNENNTCPRVIDGGLHVDARGTVGFVNDFDLNGVDRVYWVQAHQPKCPRGWVGHRKEHKWFMVVAGAVSMAVVRPNTWTSPARDLPVRSFVLSAAKPQLLDVPPGYCTASMDLSGNAILLIFSSGNIQDANADEFRFPIDYWKIPG